MKKTLLLMTVLIIGFTVFPIQKAQAIDPVTIAILAPIAIEAAQIAAPYVLRGLRSGGVHMIKMGKDIIEIFYLPIGVLQSTLGLPFGFLGNGVKNIAVGFVAPFKLALDALLMPIAFCGIGTGS